jgi:hypothetical protein
MDVTVTNGGGIGENAEVARVRLLLGSGSVVAPEIPLRP